MTTLTTRLVLFAVLATAIAGGTRLLYTQVVGIGEARGEKRIQAKWDADKATYQARIDELNTRLKKNYENHLNITAGITDELSQTKLSHQAELSALQLDHGKRMQQSATREGVYRNMAAAGTAQQRALAEHAARLDTALEEGRSLEREYRSTLEQRDRQLILLGRQLLADRMVCTNPKSDNADNAFVGEP